MNGTEATPARFRRTGSREQHERLRRDRELFARYRDSTSPVDREMVVRRFLPLARQLAAGYARGGEPFDDLFQVACLGLVRAVDRFDVERDTAFSSYAVPTIVGELKRHLRDKTWAVRVPRDLLELSLAVQRMSERLESRLGRAPTVDELADAVGADPESVLEARHALGAYHAVSLEEPLGRGDDDDTLADTLGLHEGGYGRAEDRALLDGLLGGLTGREREAVRLRFEEDLTQREIGARLGVSQMQVSRIMRASISRLREMVAEDLGADVPRAA